MTLTRVSESVWIDTFNEMDALLFCEMGKGPT